MVSKWEDMPNGPWLDASRQDRAFVWRFQAVEKPAAAFGR
jgi:hypothetical protein